MIILTENSAEYIKSIIDDNAGVSLSIKTSGCNGLTYVLEFSKNPNKLTFESYGIKIFVDPDIIHIVDGLTIDYVKVGLTGCFKYVNPNIKNSCGCGTSFSL